eukprot:gb/GFBE01062353.1/.p1 GENE.gb/GFBE01062353.1/~~gb/GFBE01062353.1/.p1  ORF type:complete len:405 (+),score=64.63 gb/GFBE01062353.1/:1-1215(+)
MSGRSRLPFELFVLCSFFVRASATSWLSIQKELSPSVQEKLDHYVKWHAKSATESGTRVFILRPSNGLGDQLMNSVASYLQYCVLSKPQLRFEIAPHAGSTDVGIWRTGLSTQIDVVHDAERTKRHDHVVVVDTSEAINRRYQDRSRLPLVSKTDLVRRLLLHPSPRVLDILSQSLPAKRPSAIVGIHLRTYIIDDGGSLDAFATSTGDGAAQRLYSRLVAQQVECAAAEMERLKVEEGSFGVFVAADSAQVVASLREVVLQRLPRATVSFVPTQPVHSNRLVSPGARDEEYEDVWATWFALLQVESICGGRSMFAESVREYALQVPQQVLPSYCQIGGWSSLLDYSKAVSRGKPATLSTLATYLKAVERRSSFRVEKHNECMPQEVLDLMLPSQGKAARKPEL